MVTAWYKALRVNNLIMVAAAQILIRYFVIAPLLAVFGMQLMLPGVAFAALVIGTVLVAAAGYLINDYYDSEIDLVNRPSQVVVGTKISRKAAYAAYVALNLVALGCAFYAARMAGVLTLFYFFPVIVGLLYLYSNTYKKQLLVGNVIVAGCTALTILLVYLFEMPLVNLRYKLLLSEDPRATLVLLYWVAGFTGFAFLTNLAREIVKDLQDANGDTLSGRETLPVVYGNRPAIYTVVTINAFVILFLVYVFKSFLTTNFNGNFDWLSLAYMLLLLAAPLAVASGLLYRATEPRQFAVVSLLIKAVMAAGMGYCFVLYVILKPLL